MICTLHHLAFRSNQSNAFKFRRTQGCRNSSSYWTAGWRVWVLCFVWKTEAAWVYMQCLDVLLRLVCQKSFCYIRHCLPFGSYVSMIIHKLGCFILETIQVSQIALDKCCGQSVQKGRWFCRCAVKKSKLETASVAIESCREPCQNLVQWQGRHLTALHFCGAAEGRFLRCYQFACFKVAEQGQWELRRPSDISNNKRPAAEASTALQARCWREFCRGRVELKIL